MLTKLNGKFLSFEQFLGVCVYICTTKENLDTFVRNFVGPLVSVRSPLIEQCDLEVDLVAKDLQTLIKLLSDEGVKIPKRHFYFWMRKLDGSMSQTLV